MSKEFHLLIDDIRTMDVDKISRTCKEGIRTLEGGEVTHLYLDNDLGDDQPMEGIDILVRARDKGYVPPNVLLVTANPIARKRMEDVLHFDLGYIRDANWWRKPIED